MKIIHIILKVILVLIISMPIIGALGIFPPATADLYNTPQAFSFIQILTETRYIVYINAVIYLLSIILICTKRMPLAALLMLPINVNVVAFHLFLDGGLLTGGAIPGNILFLINVYFLWHHRFVYRVLWQKENTETV